MKRFLPIASVIVALTGILAPIIWDVYVGSRALEIRILSTISLLEEDPILKDLLISYKSKPIENLTKIQAAVINTGRLPITAEDVKTFPTFEFGGGAEILATNIVRLEPSDINCLTHIEDGESTATLRFTLLNPGDLIEFIVYVSGNVESMPEIKSRIVGVKRIRVIDKRFQKIKTSHRPRWPIYLVLPITLLFSLFFLVGILEYPKQIRTRRLLIQHPDLLESLNDQTDFEEFIEENMGFLHSGKIKLLKSISSEDGKDFSEKKKHLIKTITRYIRQRSSVAEMFYVGLIIVPAGVSFMLLWSLL